MVEDMRRVMNFQTIGWFWDLFNRKLLIMDPPYQRRSVWSQDYKDYFVDTVLHGYPAPAIFLYKETTPEGISTYSVVDGQQRLSTLFEFANNRFPVSEKSAVATIASFRGKYFQNFPNDVKASFWDYTFAVEYLPSSNEDIINNIFDRINRNVAKLTPQELRHAKFSGEFSSEVQRQSEWMFNKLPPGVPNISAQSRKQMKDDEFVAQLLLLIEEGPKKNSQEDLDQAFAQRDQCWESKDGTITRFEEIIDYLAQLSKVEKGSVAFKTRLRYQADFYSLFGAINELIQSDKLLLVSDAASRLNNFIRAVDDTEQQSTIKEAKEYFEAARSASNDTAPRRLRVSIMKSVLVGDI
jgi:hypothetical protein